MIKRRCRYNWTTGEWDEVFTFDTDVVVITPVMRPDGSLVAHKVPVDDPMLEVWREVNRWAPRGWSRGWHD